MSIGGRIALGILVAVTVTIEAWVSIRYRNDPSVIFGNIAVLIYALLAAALVLIADYLYRTIRHPPHRQPPKW